ncbi:MAG: S41 family peptidase [Caulobacteraceae bacterium]|jgi:carboxyl-terminal processing protease
MAALTPSRPAGSGSLGLRALLFAACVVCASPAPGAEPDTAVPDPPNAKAIRLFGEAISLVRSQYVTPLDETALTEAALRGMLASLDSHSSYMSPKEYAAFTQSLSGAFTGVGLTIGIENGEVKVVSPVDESPAARAGIQSGAVVTAIDGQPTAGLGLGEVTARLRGPKGSSVRLTIKYSDKPPTDVTLVRDVIETKSVYARSIGGFGYLRITSFEQTTPAEFDAAVARLKRDLPGMKGLVLDLRNDPGGVFDVAVAVASRLLEPGQDVGRSGKNAGEAKTIAVRPPVNVLPAVRMVVLVNSGSASCAEFLAGALEDNHRAVVVGMTSWGKGIVQTIIPLDEGRDGALSVTTVRYYTPTGRSIQRLGIVPDLQVAQSVDEVKTALDANAMRSEGTVANALDNESHLARQPPRDVEIPPEQALAPQAPQVLFAHPLPDDSDIAADFQLQRALDVLSFGGVAEAKARKPARIYPPTAGGQPP